MKGTVRAGRREESAKAEELATFPHAVRFVSVEPARNRYRFYTLAWQPSLWDGLTLLLTWGRLGTPGQRRTRVYTDRARAQPEVARVIRRRLRHGYRVVEWH